MDKNNPSNEELLKTLKLLQESENRFKLVLDNMPILLNAFDENGLFIVWNKACMQSTGYTAEEMIGNPKAMEMLYPDPEYRQLVMEMSEDKNANINTFELVAKNGEKRAITWFDTYHDVKIPGWASWGLGQDVTQSKKTEDQLNFQSLVLDQIQDCVTVTDLNGVITYVNQAEIAKLGYTKEELIGQSVHKYGENKTKSTTQNGIIQKTLECGKWRGEVINQTSDGKEIIMDARTQILYNLDETPIGLCGISTDITERKRIEEMLRYERDLFSAGPVFTIQYRISEGYPVIQISENVKDILGYTREEIIQPNFRFAELTHKEDLELVFPQIKENIAKRKDTFEQSYRLRCKDGIYRWFYDFSRIERDENGEARIIRGYLFDQTHIKQTEQELTLAKEKAEESDKLKNAFINNISHEIRTPLNSILGFGQLLSEADLSKQERAEHYQTLKRSSFRLIRTVNNILDVSMVTAGSIQIKGKAFRLNPLLQDLLQNSTRQCVENNISIDLNLPQSEKDPEIISDKDLVLKILEQLIDNAIKFTNEGGITFGYEKQDAFLKFFVQDTGTGISPDKRAAIFKPFAQADPSTTRAHEGNGLGLTIAKGLTEKLGGTIWVDSIPNEGSTFFFTIPYKAVECDEETTITPPGYKINSGEPYILIAEDDDANYLYLQSVLGLMGYSNLHAANGKEAIQLCDNHPEISLVLMDIKMPVMNGIEATKQIKTKRPDLPIIAITAHAQTGDEQRMLDAGCDAYASKPVSREKLNVLINAYITSKS